MRPLLAFGLLAGLPLSSALGAAPEPLPSVPEGWSIELVASAPAILYPTACVVAPNGTIYVGQDPMDMPGPPTEPSDSVVAIKNGRVSVFAEKLGPVMGLEWVDGTLYVVHAPFLSAFTDSDGDVRADRRVDLIAGLGPNPPGFNGLNDHIASGVRLGIDGYLYITVGDKGIPHGVGKDGTTVRLFGGGVIRIRPDGTGLEVVSTGERNPLSPALSDRDELFTYGNDDDSKQWPNSLTHHIVGGHYGYPYQFENSLRPPAPGRVRPPKRYLPILGGQIGGSGAQGVCYNEDGLPARYRGNLFVCDWGLQAVLRYVVEKFGATFRISSKEELVTKGDLRDFRPCSLAVSPQDGSLYLTDWAFNGWLADGPKTGRLYRLMYTGADRVEPAARPTGDELSGLDHPALSVRVRVQRAAERQGVKAADALVRRFASREGTTGRIHALWALSAIGGEAAGRALRSGLTDSDAEIRLQAVRAIGIRPRGWGGSQVAGLLKDKDAAVRREAAIALGRIGDAAVGPSLMAALGDPDPFVAWSVRHAIRQLRAWEKAQLVAALQDPKRRDDALALTDEAWTSPVVEALTTALGATTDARARARIVANLAGQYRRYPEWSGRWFGTNPLIGQFPLRTKDWDPEAMGRIRASLDRSLKDPSPEVRREAIAGLRGVGPAAGASLRGQLVLETDEQNIGMICELLRDFRDPLAVQSLTDVLGDRKRPIGARLAALAALSTFGSRESMNARLALVYDRTTPVELLAKALPDVGRTKAVPANDLAEFLNHKEPLVRAAAVRALAVGRTLPASCRQRIQALLDDPDHVVRTAAIGAVAATHQREAIPKLLALVDSKKESDPARLALAAMPDPRAIPVYIDALNGLDSGLRAAAESALLAIRDLAASELEAKVRARAFKPWATEAVERILVPMRPVAEWKVIGPFPRTAPQIFLGESAIDFTRPQVGLEGRRLSWTRREADPATGRLVLDDFKAGAGDRGGFGYDTNGSPDLGVFAFAEIHSDDERSALVLIGSSGSLLVTVNEQPVYKYQDLAGRPFAADTDRIRVKLHKGVNRFLVQSRQGIGTWCFSLHVSDPSSGLFAAQPGKVTLDELRSYALAHDGDARKGRAIFFDPRGIGCVKCHSAGGQGTANIGPDLTGLALKYDKAEIVRSVLDPSSRIATGYQPLLLALKDGQVLAGLLRSESDLELELVDAEGRVTRVPRSEVEERRVGEVSLMPTGLVDTLAPERFADLIAYLQSLRSR